MYVLSEEAKVLIFYLSTGNISAMGNIECRKFYRIALCSSLIIATLGLIAIPPIINKNTTSRIMTALSGGKIDCTQGVLPLNKTYPFDAIVIPGAGLNQDEIDGSYFPNSAERKRLLAGAVEYVNGKSDIVILQDGALPEGADSDITRKYLQAYVRVISNFKNDIPDENIILDNRSINTSSGMSELKEIDKKYGIRKHLVVDSKSHGNRSTAYGCDMGIAISWKSAEDLNATVDPNQAVINAKKHSPKLLITMKETSELLLDMYNPGGSWTVTLKRVSSNLRNSRTGPELGHYFPLLITALLLRKKKNDITAKK